MYLKMSYLSFLFIVALAHSGIQIEEQGEWFFYNADRSQNSAWFCYHYMGFKIPFLPLKHCLLLLGGKVFMNVRSVLTLIPSDIIGVLLLILLSLDFPPSSLSDNFFYVPSNDFFINCIYFFGFITMFLLLTVWWWLLWHCL